jgi:hypothetical protein
VQNAIFGKCAAGHRVLALIGLAVASAVFAGSANAQTSPTLVQNVDEPARNPYQQTVNASTCESGFDFCTFQFTGPPAKTKLRMTYVSCYFEINDNGGVALVTVNNGEPSIKSAFIPGIAQGRPDVIVANAEINLYANAGDKPSVTVQANTSSVAGGLCTLTGYYVND